MELQSLPAARVSSLPGLLCFCLVLSSPTGATHAFDNAQYYLDLLYEGRPSTSYKSYSETSQSYGQYIANVPAGGYVGHLYAAEPQNACSSVAPPPSMAISTATSFLLVNGLGDCTQMDVVTNARNAGYDLVIVYKNNRLDDDLRGLSQEAIDFEFPVVSTGHDYGHYLKRTALSYTANDPITIRVRLAANQTWIILIIITVVSFLPSTALILSVVVCIAWLRVRYRRVQTSREHRREISNQQQWQQAALRHLRQRAWQQEVMVALLQRLSELGPYEGCNQQPLGTEETKRLRKQVYTSGDKGGDSCVVCVENFLVGDWVKVLPCGHNFHAECIDEWLSRHSSLCPHCKADVAQGLASRARDVARQQQPGAACEDEDQQRLLSADCQREPQHSYGSVYV